MAWYLTTTDNPFHPGTQFDLWQAYDLQKGYNSCSYLARIARTSDLQSPAEVEAEVDRAIDEICYYNVNGMYTKVR